MSVPVEDAGMQLARTERRLAAIIAADVAGYCRPLIMNDIGDVCSGQIPELACERCYRLSLAVIRRNERFSYGVPPLRQLANACLKSSSYLGFLTALSAHGRTVLRVAKSQKSPMSGLKCLLLIYPAST